MHSCPSCLTTVLLKCIAHSIALGNHLEAIAGSELSGASSNWHFLLCPFTIGLCELHWLPVGFWMKFKVLVINFTAFHVWLSPFRTWYLRHQISSVVSPTWYIQVSWVHSTSLNSSWELRKHVFSVSSSDLWKSMPPKWSTHFPGVLGGL